MMNLHTAVLNVLFPLLFILATESHCQEITSNCSVAFYPLTACSKAGQRSTFLQFEDCSETERVIRLAWFGISPISVTTKTGATQLLPETWQEVVIPRSKPQRGRLTIFYKREHEEDFEAIQIVIPSCKKIGST